MEKIPIKVIYVYKHITSSVVIKYVDEDFKEISSSDTITGNVGSDYETFAKDIKGYELVEVLGEEKGWRIDYWLVSPELKDKIVDAKILTDVYGSDHCPVELEIEV